MSSEKDKSGSQVHDAAKAPMRHDANAASRARNKTVMLTPEMAGQMRAQIQSASDDDADPVSDLLPPITWDDAKDRQAPARVMADVASQHRASANRVPEPQAVAPRPMQASTAGEVVVAESRAKAGVDMKTGKVRVVSSKSSKIIGFLVSYKDNENGEVIEIRQGRWLLTSKFSDQSDQQIVIDDETISPLHAIIRATADGKIDVLDQLTEYGTGLTRASGGAEIDLAGAKEKIEHGDTIRFGKREFVVCLVPAK